MTEDQKKEIIQAYLFLREKNHTISDETLNYMKEVALNPASFIESKGEKQSVIMVKKSDSGLLETYEQPIERESKDSGEEKCTLPNCDCEIVHADEGTSYAVCKHTKSQPSDTVEAGRTAAANEDKKNKSHE